MIPRTSVQRSKSRDSTAPPRCIPRAQRATPTHASSLKVPPRGASRGTPTGAGGAIVGSLLFLGSLVAATLTVKRLLLQVDRDDYLGGYHFSVPVAGPRHEAISFDLTGSDGL